MQKITLSGFDFVKIGTAELCQQGVDVQQGTKEYSWNLALSLIKDDFADAEQSTIRRQLP